MIAYPGDVFPESAQRENAEGRAVVSADGRAQLLVGAFVNEDDLSLADYRQFLLEDTYAGAEIDYAPVRRKWFVLSGTRDGRMF